MYIYDDNNNNLHVHKKMLSEKKIVYAVSFKKNTFTCWTKVKTKTLLVTAKQLIRKNSICCLKNQTIFFTQ